MVIQNMGDPPQECSGGGASRGDGYFVPSADDVAVFERSLERHLRHGLNGFNYFAWVSRPDWQPKTIDPHWNRTYMGIVRGERRYIYGLFERRFKGERPQVWRGFWPIVECDAGPTRFGAEFDLTAKSVSGPWMAGGL